MPDTEHDDAELPAPGDPIDTDDDADDAGTPEDGLHEPDTDTEPPPGFDDGSDPAAELS
jgi:hypothetical protein